VVYTFLISITKNGFLIPKGLVTCMKIFTFKLEMCPMSSKMLAMMMNTTRQIKIRKMKFKKVPKILNNLTPAQTRTIILIIHLIKKC
jgi:hypothetical protein